MKRHSPTKAALAAVLAGNLLTGNLMAAELPVKRVVLYKHGVGYFERGGEVPANETARFDFKTGEMNDVLKSLIVEEAGGGKVTGVRYDAAKPTQSNLRLDPEMALVIFLDRLRGAKVEVLQNEAKVVGSIVSGRVVPATPQRGQQELLVLLLESSELRTVDITQVASVRLQDPMLQLKLRDHLAAIAGQRNNEQRSVYIDGEATRARQVRASYLSPVPVWKSSYRLVMGATDAALEGWAIVDNTTDSDWANVQLSLVSGKPVSFQSRLYEPRYVERPFAELAEDKPVAPEVYQRAMMAESAEGVVGGVPGGMARGVGGGLISRGPAAPKARAAADMVMVAAAPPTSSAEAQTVGQERGELFEYAFSNPVTVKKNQSAMLPFLQQKVEAKKLLIYSDHASPNPRSAAEITNGSGKTLDGGPITVFDAGTYAGEALVETVKAGEKRLISYGVDLGTRITKNLDSDRKDFSKLKIRNGVLVASFGVTQKTTYTIRNVDARAKNLVIEHPIEGRMKLLNQKPQETTAAAYRFLVPLKPNGNETFVVNEEAVEEEYTALSSIENDQIAIFLKNPNVTQPVRDAITRVQGMKQQLATLNRQISDNETRSTRLAQDQERTRRNMESLNAVTGQQEQVQKYARELAARETQLATMRDQNNDLRTKKAALEEDLNKLLADLTI